MRGLRRERRSQPAFVLWSWLCVCNQRREWNGQHKQRERAQETVWERTGNDRGADTRTVLGVVGLDGAVRQEG